jgi:drug/metabolite transporter (DMT)-like permease
MLERLKIRSHATEIRTTTLTGIGLMLLSVAIFAVSNTFSKWLVAFYPATQIFFVRGFAALVILSPFLMRDNFAVARRVPRPGLHVIRVALSVADGLLFFTAVKYIPLVDASTCYLAAPIFVTALSALILREPVGWRRWCAVIVGFAGVIVALQPTGAAFSVYALIALVGCLCSSALMIVTRHLRGTHDIVLAFSQIFGSFAIGGIIASAIWVPPTLAIVGVMLLSGVVNVAGLMAANRAVKLAPASVIAPFQYTGIIWAAALGYSVFGDVPSLNTVLGAAIVAGAGTYIFLRERKVMHREPEPNPPQTV